MAVGGVKGFAGAGAVGVVGGGGNGGKVGRGGAFALVHRGEVGDVDEFRTTDGEDGDGDGEGWGADGEEVDDGVLFVAFARLDGRGAGFLVGLAAVVCVFSFDVVLVGVGLLAAGVFIVGAGRGFFLAGEVAVVQVGFGVGVDAEVAAGQFVGQFGRGKVHFFLRVFVSGFFDHPQARVAIGAAADAVPAAGAGFGVQLVLAAMEQLFRWGRVARGLISNHCNRSRKGTGGMG